MSALDHVWKRAGGPAFPHDVPVSAGGGGPITYHGMTLRDYFATHADADEIEAAVHNSLSLASKELIVGRKRPVEPPGKAAFPGALVLGDHDARMQYQLALFEFNADLAARLRYKMADAMLAARDAA